MTPDRCEHLCNLVKKALELAPEEQELFLEQACGMDVDLFIKGRFLLEKEVPTGAGDSVDPDGEFIGPGQMVGPYKIEKELGSGGMGIVFLATREDETRMKVALKILRRGMDTRDIRQRFQRERRILGTLKHPNIAQLHDSGATSGGRPYFAMEYVDGEPIDDYCDYRKLDIRQRLQLFSKVCSAVSYAHRNMVIHRDLKPANILITPEGDPKLLDLGIGIDHYQFTIWETVKPTQSHLGLKVSQHIFDSPIYRCRDFFPPYFCSIQPGP